MIFQSELVPLILSGEKTVTRRPIRFDPDAYLHQAVIVHSPSGRPLYCLGKDYSVQPGRGKVSVARIRITGLRVNRLHMLQMRDAQHEGCRFVDLSATVYDFPEARAASYMLGFIATWEALYHGTKFAWPQNPWVAIISFSLIAETERNGHA
jgi:hypothetical protein